MCVFFYINIYTHIYVYFYIYINLIEDKAKQITWLTMPECNRIHLPRLFFFFPPALLEETMIKGFLRVLSVVITVLLFQFPPCVLAQVSTASLLSCQWWAGEIAHRFGKQQLLCLSSRVVSERKTQAHNRLCKFQFCIGYMQVGLQRVHYSKQTKKYC